MKSPNFPTNSNVDGNKNNGPLLTGIGIQDKELIAKGTFQKSFKWLPVKNQHVRWLNEAFASCGRNSVFWENKILCTVNISSASRDRFCSSECSRGDRELTLRIDNYSFGGYISKMEIFCFEWGAYLRFLNMDG